MPKRFKKNAYKINPLDNNPNLKERQLAGMFICPSVEKNNILDYMSNNFAPKDSKMDINGIYSILIQQRKDFDAGTTNEEKIKFMKKIISSKLMRL